MGARKLKKKPVLVLDPEELAQAHQLFQQGAAEQLGEFEPADRPRASVSLFGLAPMSEDDGEDFFASARAPLNDDDDECAVEAEAPAPEKVLSLTRATEPKAARRSALDAIREAHQTAGPAPEALEPEAPSPEAYEPAPMPPQAPVEPAPLAFEPDPEPEPAQDVAASLPTASPLWEDATAPQEPAAQPPVLPAEPEAQAMPDASLFGDRSAEEPPVQPASAPIEPAAPQRLVRNFDDVAPGFSRRDAIAASTPEPAAPHVASEPVSPTLPETTIEPIVTETPFRDEGIESITVFEDAEAGPPHVEPEPLDPLPAVQNSLRARLVREDVCLAEPEPSAWQKMVDKVRRWFSSLTGR